MTNDLVTRLKARALSLRGLGGIAHDDANMDEEAADRIEELQKQLSLINNTLNVTLNETITANWKEFCKALIEETRELLGEKE